MDRVRYLPMLVALTVVISAGAAIAQQAGHPPRDEWQRVDDVFQELGITAGSHVADLGAGSGWFTTRLSKFVGPQGRVYAVDVNPVSLRELRDGLPKELTNIEIVRADEHDPKLPAGQLDAVLVVNAYHEFAEYAAVLLKVRDALKPGGRLVLIEPTPLREEDTTRAAQMKRHTLAIQFAEDDVTQAGFEIVKRDLSFVKGPAHQEGASTHAPIDWLLVARRPVPGDADLASPGSPGGSQPF